MSLDVTLYMVVDVGTDNKECIELYEANVTHNLNTMADHAGIYKALWRPEEIEAYQAKDIIEALELGLNELLNRASYFEQFNSSNGWGSYSGLVKFVKGYLNACKRYPNAMIEVNR